MPESTLTPGYESPHSGAGTQMREHRRAIDGAGKNDYSQSLANAPFIPDGRSKVFSSNLQISPGGLVLRRGRVERC